MYNCTHTIAVHEHYYRCTSVLTEIETGIIILVYYQLMEAQVLIKNMYHLLYNCVYTQNRL